MKRLVLSALVASALAASAEAQEFRHRGWGGARMPNDKTQGCAMALELRREAAFVVYANAERAFKIGLAGREWKLEQGVEALAAVTFDDSPPILLKGAPASPTTILFEPLDFKAEGGLQPLVEAARSVKMTYAGKYMRARLSGSSRAIELLQRCAAAPERTEPRTTAAETTGGAPSAAEERSVDFSFLRQGMTAADANARLLDAGWQAEALPDGVRGDADPALKALHDKGVFAQSCDGAPPSCVIDYVDAYGNALKVTAEGEGEPRLRKWRLNPEDAPGRQVQDDAPEDR